MFVHTVRIIGVPFYQVNFPDFFIGDQVRFEYHVLLS